MDMRPHIMFHSLSRCPSLSLSDMTMPTIFAAKDDHVVQNVAVVDDGLCGDEVIVVGVVLEFKDLADVGCLLGWHCCQFKASRLLANP